MNYHVLIIFICLLYVTYFGVRSILLKLYVLKCIFFLMFDRLNLVSSLNIFLFTFTTRSDMFHQKKENSRLFCFVLCACYGSSPEVVEVS